MNVNAYKLLAENAVLSLHLQGHAGINKPDFVDCRKGLCKDWHDIRAGLELPVSGENVTCLICGQRKPWGVFDSQTGAAVCIDCRDRARS